MLTNIHSSGDITKAFNNVFVRLSDAQKRINSFVLVQHDSGILLHTKLQAIFNLKFQHPAEKLIYEIIVTHALKAEKIGPGGFDKCIENLLDILKKSNIREPNFMYRDFLEVTLGSRTNDSIATLDDLTWVIDSIFLSDRCKEKYLLEEALKLSGFTGRIVVEKSINQCSVELVRGYTFNHAPIWFSNVRLENPHVICIDGFIETVSEIHKLLEDSNKINEHVLLFVRGISEDVKHTLKVNYDRGTLKIIPIIVKFDMEGMNSLNDISISSGTRLISSNLGDIISNVTIADSSKIESAIVYPTKVLILNSKTSKNVDIHVQFLKNKRADEKIEDVQKLLDIRIRSLSPNHVIVRLVDDKNFIASSQSIDYVLRMYKSLIELGTITIDNKKWLTATYVASHLHANKCYETITSLGSIITRVP